MRITASGPGVLPTMRIGLPDGSTKVRFPAAQFSTARRRAVRKAAGARRSSGSRDAVSQVAGRRSVIDGPIPNLIGESKNSRNRPVNGEDYPAVRETPSLLRLR